MDESRSVTDEKLYEEVGRNYRFFATWRQLGFAGHLAALSAVLAVSVGAYKDGANIAWLIPIFASPIGLVFWIVDRRTNRITRYAIQAGSDLEKRDGGAFFTEHLNERLKQDSNKSESFWTHTDAARLFYFGSIVALIGLGIALWFFGPPVPPTP